MNRPVAAPSADLPLVLDLDGTVLRTDLLFEGLAAAIKRRPWTLVLAVLWILRGRAAFKRKVAEAASLRVDLLPLNEEIVAYARARHAAGQPVYIASAADEGVARRIGDRLGFVHDVLASDGRTNLKGRHKAAALRARFPSGFVYAGDAWIDLAVWKAAAGGVFAGRSRRLEQAAERCTALVGRLPQRRAGPATWARALRLHQWAKNALVFIPLLLSGHGLELRAWLGALLAFLAIGSVSSATYLVNDLLDLADDRNHPTKKDRPLASGALPLAQGMAAAPVGVALGLGLGWIAGGAAALGCLLLYLLGTLAYSLRFKRVPIADVMIIGGLFTVRLLLGAVVVAAPIKPWLFVFSMFLFTALALAKRAAEVLRLASSPGARLGGRGYFAADAPMVIAFGVSAGVAAILVLVLYLLDEAFAQTFYGAPQLLWAAPLMLSLWLGRIWLLCGRGELDDDPVAFAVRDPVSLGLGAVLGVALLGALFL